MNEPAPQVNPSKSVSVESLTSNLASKHAAGSETAPKKRGRHPKDCTCPNCTSRRESLANDPAQGKVESAANVVTPVDLEMIGQAVKAVVGAFDRTLGLRVYKLAKSTGADDSVARELVSSTVLTGAEMESICNLSGILAQKYSILGRFAPEMLLGCIVVGYGSRAWMTLNRLSEMQREQKRHATPTRSVESSSDRG